MGLIIRSSTIHAAGCYTTSPIRKGARVVEYTGPILDKEEADLLYADRPVTYLFGIGDGTQVIDGHGTAMFVNHSCNPNCETDEIDGHVWIMALRDIASGEELCYDYLLYDGDESEELPCNCGAARCRGTMYSPEEIRRRHRLERKRTGRSAPLKPKKRGSSAGTKQRLKPERKPARHQESSKAGTNRRRQTGGRGRAR